MTAAPRIARLAVLVDQLTTGDSSAADEARTILAEMQDEADRAARRRAHEGHQAQRAAFYRGQAARRRG